MARPLRINYEGAVHHVTIRGNERRAIFLASGDHERFNDTLAGSVRFYNVRLYLFCHMTNHVHLVLETPQANLSRFMQRLKTGRAYDVGPRYILINTILSLWKSLGNRLSRVLCPHFRALRELKCREQIVLCYLASCTI